MAKDKLPGLKQFSVDSLTRSRVKSCNLCRERKRKCSREIPTCSHCQKHGLKCSYIQKNRASEEIKLQEQAEILLGLSNQAHTLPRQQIAPPAKSFDFLLIREEELQHQSSTSAQTNQTPLPSISVDLTASSTYSSRSRHLSTSSLSSLWSGKDNTRECYLSLPPTAVKMSISEKSGILNQKLPMAAAATPILPTVSCDVASGFSKRPEQAVLQSTLPVLKSFWPQIHTDQLRQFKHDPNVRVGPMYTKIFSSSLNQTGRSVEFDMELLASYMPPRKVADTLFARYINSVHPIMPILDMKVLHPQYEMFWNSPKSASLSFYIVVYAILYAASVSEFEEKTITKGANFKNHEGVDLMRQLVGATEIALASSDFPAKVTLVGLQALVILHSVIRNDCRTDDCGSVASLVRLAQLIELNRDPQSYHKISEFSAIQERRLLWWHIYFLDCSTALSLRLSPMIMEGEHDTYLPQEYFEEKQGLFRLDQGIAFANGRFRWAETCNRIMRDGFSVKGLDSAQIDRAIQDIDNLSMMSTSLIQRILDPANMMPNLEDFVAFSSSMMSTFSDRSFCLLNMLMAGSKSRPETSLTSELLAINWGPQLVKHVIHLLLEFCKHGNMPSNVKFVWEIRKFQPIQALLLLLQNLIGDIRKIHDDHGLEMLKLDERVSAIEQAFSSLSYLSEHTTRLCKERWQLLRELRDVVWDSIFTAKAAFLLDTSSLKHSSPGELPETFSEDWDAIIQKLTSAETVIDENIFAKTWDEQSGHYVM